MADKKSKFTPKMERTLRAIAKTTKVQKPKITKMGRRYDEEGLLKKVRRKLHELYYGPKAYARKKPITTVRTRVLTEKGLKPAGLTKKELARLRGKK